MDNHTPRTVADLLPLFGDRSLPSGGDFAALITASLNVEDNRFLLKRLFFANADYLVLHGVERENDASLASLIYGREEMFPSFEACITALKASHKSKARIYAVKPDGEAIREPLLLDWSTDAKKLSRLEIVVDKDSPLSPPSGTAVTLKGKGPKVYLTANIRGDGNCQGVVVENGTLVMRGTIEECAGNTGSGIQAKSGAVVRFSGTFHPAPGDAPGVIHVADTADVALFVENEMNNNGEEIWMQIEERGTAIFGSPFQLYKVKPSYIAGPVTLPYALEKR